jgi:4-amino-4-deoxy-L-arabinose transferase-like glycosyltransferase
MDLRRWIVPAGLALLALAHLLVCGWLTVPGYLSIDEGIYHLMAEAMGRGSFDLGNGYAAFPSEELTLYVHGLDHHTFGYGGRMVAQYPTMATMLSAPLYLLEGYSGLFRLNALSFIVAVALCYGLGLVAFEDRKLAALGAGVFALASFAWGYSLAAWPHMIHLGLVTAAFLVVYRGIRGGGPAWLFPLGGLLLGVDIGVRLDGVFVIPALVLLLFYRRPIAWKALGLFGLGLLPGLAFLSVTNHLKFGTWQPLSYGPVAESSATHYLGIAVLGTIPFLLRPWLVRLDWRRELRRRWLPLLGGVVGLGGALVALPGSRALLLPWLRGFYLLVVDLRIPEGGMESFGAALGDGGGLYYVGGFKKALLQSLPWLPLLLVSLRAWLKGEPSGRAFPALILVPLLYSAAFAQQITEGGVCLNLRYFLPMLPFLAVLAAPGLASVAAALRGRGALLALVGGLGVLLLFLPSFGPMEQPAHERLVLQTPLLLSAALGLALVASWLPSAARTRMLGPLTATLAVACLAWASLMAFGYDARLERAWRQHTLGIARAFEPHLGEPTLLVADFVDPYYGLVASGRVHLASPVHDNGEDLPALVAWHLEQGWAVHGALAEKNWQIQLRQPWMSAYRVVPIAQEWRVRLARFEPVDAAP